MNVADDTVVSKNILASEGNLLPDGWNLTPLEDFGHLTDGDWILKKYYTADGVRLLQVGDVGITRFIGKSNRYIALASAKSLGCTFLQPQQVLISRMPDPVGRACLMPELPYPSITAVDVAILSPDKSRVDPTFAMFALNSPLVLSQCQSLATGATRQRVSRSNLSKVLLPLPPLPEQRVIAHVLRTVQRAKEATEKVIAATQKLKQSLLRHLFTYGPVPFDQTHKVKLKETEIGAVPEHWSGKPIGKLCDVANGYAFKSDDYVDEGILNFRVVNITNNGTLDVQSDTRYLPDSFYEQYSKYLLHPQDILLVMVGATRGKIGIITESVLPSLMNQNMWRVVSRDSKIPQRYLYHYLIYTISTFSNIYSEEARGFFSKSHFRQFPLYYPQSSSDIKQIVNCIDTVENGQEALRIRANAVEGLFRSALQHLMTGRVRIKDALKTISEAV